MCWLINQEERYFWEPGKIKGGIQKQIQDLTSDTNSVSWGARENSEASFLATEKKMAAVLVNFKDNDLKKKKNPPKSLLTPLYLIPKLK